MIKAIIFDLDGTLWDSTGCAVHIWERVLARRGIVNVHTDRETVAGLMGKTMEEIGTMLFPDLPETERTAIMDDYAAKEVEYLYENGAIIYDGVKETLKKLQKEYELFIVSNSQDGYVQAFMHAHDMEELFKDIEMSGRTGQIKGRNIRKIISRNEIDRAVYVGDTHDDELAAGYAGIPFIWAAYGFGRASDPDAMISSIKDLPERVKEFFN